MGEHSSHGNERKLRRLKVRSELIRTAGSQSPTRILSEGSRRGPGGGDGASRRPGVRSVKGPCRGFAGPCRDCKGPGLERFYMFELLLVLLEVLVEVVVWVTMQGPVGKRDVVAICVEVTG